jgi:hypothetical protein
VWSLLILGCEKFENAFHRFRREGREYCGGVTLRIIWPNFLRGILFLQNVSQSGFLVSGHVARHAFKTPRRMKDRTRQIRRRPPGEVLQRFMNMLACSRASALFQCPACGLYRFLERFRAARHDRAIDKLPADPFLIKKSFRASVSAGLLSGISVHRHRPEPISLGAGARLPWNAAKLSANSEAANMSEFLEAVAEL